MGGQAGLVKGICRGEPIAPAGTDVVKVSLESFLNTFILRLHSTVKNSSSEIESFFFFSCFAVSDTSANL